MENVEIKKKEEKKQKKNYTLLIVGALILLLLIGGAYYFIFAKYSSGDINKKQLMLEIGNNKYTYYCTSNDCEQLIYKFDSDYALLSDVNYYVYDATSNKTTKIDIKGNVIHAFVAKYKNNIIGMLYTTNDKNNKYNYYSVKDNKNYILNYEYYKYSNNLSAMINDGYYVARSSNCDVEGCLLNIVDYKSNNIKYKTSSLRVSVDVQLNGDSYFYEVGGSGGDGSYSVLSKDFQLLDIDYTYHSWMNDDGHILVTDNTAKYDIFKTFDSNGKMIYSSKKYNEIFEGLGNYIFVNNDGKFQLIDNDEKLIEDFSQLLSDNTIDIYSLSIHSIDAIYENNQLILVLNLYYEGIDYVFTYNTITKDMAIVSK